MDFIVSYAIDLICFLLSVLLVIAYQFYIKHKESKNPAYTVTAINVMARTAWVKTIMRDGQGILAVQTLRNSTMAATFLASTAVLLIIGVLTLSGQEIKLDRRSSDSPPPAGWIRPTPGLRRRRHARGRARHLERPAEMDALGAAPF